MQLKVLRGLSPFTTRFSLLAALSLVGAVALASGCASELDDPDAYAAAVAGGGAPPTAAGGTPGTPTGGTVTTTGGAPAAAGGTTSGGSAPPLPACAKTVLTAQCTTCHAPATKDFFGGLDLVGDDVGTRLRNATAKNGMATNAASCGTMLINADNPAQSVLLKRISGTSDCGSPMPAAPGVTGSDLECLKTWIMSF